MRRLFTGLSALALAGLLMVPNVDSRTAGPSVYRNTQPTLGANTPAYCVVSHSVNLLGLAVSNNGTFGNGLTNGGSTTNCLTGEQVPSCEYPLGTRNEYLFAGAFWIGAVVGRDTLVSTGADGWSVSANEFAPDVSPLGDVSFRSTIDPTKPELFNGAISEEDYIMEYYDTCTACDGSTDAIEGRAHRPLNIRVRQRSFAWSYQYAEDLVLFDFSIENIGGERLRRVYLGLYVDADILGFGTNPSQGAQDDISGFLQTIPASYMPASCPAIDTVNIAWVADADGDLDAGPLSPPAPEVTGTRVVRTPSDSLVISYNWWTSNTQGAPGDFGPVQKGNAYPEIHTGTGTPEGDRSKYARMKNGEFDYDQAFTGTITSTDPIWVEPPPDAKSGVSVGFDTRYLLSFGPFDIDPGQTLPLSFSYVGGRNFHTDPQNFPTNMPDNPAAFYEGLDFDDLGLNATWSSWIYDNPGVDTDGDGFFGRSRICVAGGDSTRIQEIFYEGDGVPDFRGASPPPAPVKWVEPSQGNLKIRFNGFRSETDIDVFSNVADFEGYRVYYGRDERSSSYQLWTSYDLENFQKFFFDPSAGDEGDYVLSDVPFTLDSLRTLYAPGGVTDSFWNPLQFPRSAPLRINIGGQDSIFYFQTQDFNQSELGNPSVTKIRKTYPNAERPPFLSPDSVLTPEDSATYLTDDGFFRFYEYEVEIPDILPSVPYYVNVTAFDFGSPRTGLPPLETPTTLNPLVSYALDAGPTTNEFDGEVYAFPNPYRLDADLISAGFERQPENRSLAPDRLRRIRFANLPPECTISIFSLDGDLVQEIFHNVPSDDPLSNVAEWDLITRNRQLVVSGTYYWTVETPNGDTQIGKLVIIL